jgi:DNA modification methylase
MKVAFSREWAMPSSNTFDIKPINRLIHKYLKPGMISCDPFANKNRLAKHTNDIDPAMGAEYCMDALDFLRQFKYEAFELVLYDPPYSPRQVAECYKKLGKTVNVETTQASFWGNLKKEIARVTEPGGIVISFGWNSNGIGKKNGFEIIEILNVAHGGQHNDTICTVEIKTKTLFS